MSYDENGIGVSELVFLSVNYPEIYQTVETAIDDDEASGLELARIAIEAANAGLIEREAL